MYHVSAQGVDERMINVLLLCAWQCACLDVFPESNFVKTLKKSPSDKTVIN